VSSNRKKTQSFIEKQVQKNDLRKKTKGSFIFKQFKSTSNNSNFMDILKNKLTTEKSKISAIALPAVLIENDANQLPSVTKEVS
jgi:hypothetical protein